MNVQSRRTLSLLVVAAALFSATQEVEAQTVFINGARQSGDVIAALEAAYRTEIPDGRYWYDPRSGLWGHQGGPTVGLIQAGIDFGAALREDASAGDTWVLVNGRRLPISELMFLQSLVGTIQPGRYWLDGYGNAGFEGGPALVNLIAAQRAQPSRGGWNHNTLFGNWGGDGNCSYFNHPNGSSVMAGSC